MDPKILHATNEVARRAREYIDSGRDLCAGAYIFEAFSTYADTSAVFDLLYKSHSIVKVESLRALVETLFGGDTV